MNGSVNFTSLGRVNNDYKGLDTFPNPGCKLVILTSDEVTAVCPVTGQPDWYLVSVTCHDCSMLVESKTFKLFLQSFRNKGLFCEALAVEVATTVQKATGGVIEVVVEQKPRGGVEIKAFSTKGAVDVKRHV